MTVQEMTKRLVPVKQLKKQAETNKRTLTMFSAKLKQCSTTTKDCEARRKELIERHTKLTNEFTALNIDQCFITPDEHNIPVDELEWKGALANNLIRDIERFPDSVELFVKECCQGGGDQDPVPSAMPPPSGGGDKVPKVGMDL
jgi:hypothetical protein